MGSESSSYGHYTEPKEVSWFN